MKEFILPIVEPFMEGLRREERQRRGPIGLVEAMNAVPREQGMGLYEALDNPFSAATLSAAGIEVRHPFPQLFRGKNVTLLADLTAIFIVDESDWSLTQVVTYNAYDLATAKAIVAGESWQFIDLGPVWILHNGSCTVFKANLEPFLGRKDVAVVQDSLSIQTGCYHRGRVLFGGFDPSSFWSAKWETFWSYWRDQVSKDVLNLIPSANALESNFVFWSSIGGGDVFWLFYPELMQSGPLGEAGFNTSAMLFNEQLMRNELGWMPMPWQGTVNLVKPLGKNVMVYGTQGISAMLMVSEPAATFGLRDILPLGVASRNAIGGDENRHVFIDEAGELWTIDASLKLDRLGYKEFMKEMLGNDIIVSFDSQLREFYISDRERSYILTKKGLGQIKDRVTSLIFAGNTLKGISESTGADMFLVTTDTFDMGYRGIKFIQGLEVGIDTDREVWATVYYRHSLLADFVMLNPVRLNPKGGVMIPVTGADFRVSLLIDPPGKYVKPDYISVHWKAIDKTMRRGPSVSEAVA